MMRPLGAIVLYALVGAALTLVVYRIVLGGPLAPAGMERSIDGLIAFVAIVMSTELAFGAAAVAGIMAAGARWSLAAVAAVSAAVAGLVTAGMMLWFPGLDGAFPAVAALSAAVCALLAGRLGLLQPAGTRP